MSADPVITAWHGRAEALERLALKYSIKAAETRLADAGDPMADVYGKLSVKRRDAAEDIKLKILERWSNETR